MRSKQGEKDTHPGLQEPGTEVGRYLRDTLNKTAHGALRKNQNLLCLGTQARKLSAQG